jgi:ribosomal protein L10
MEKAKEEKKIKASISNKKKNMLKEMVKLLLENNTIMVSSIKSMPCSQFQTIKKKIKEINGTEARVIKKKVMKLAMDEAAKTKSNIKELCCFLMQTPLNYPEFWQIIKHLSKPKQTRLRMKI